MRDYSHGSYHNILLRSQDLQDGRIVSARVDRNDSYTRFPAKLLTEMGWSVKGWVHDELGDLAAHTDCSCARMALGAVIIEIENTMIRELAVFEDDNCQPTLGAHLLHCLGVKVAPQHRTMFEDEILYPRPRKVMLNDPS